MDFGSVNSSPYLGSLSPLNTQDFLQMSLPAGNFLGLSPMLSVHPPTTPSSMAAFDLAETDLHVDSFDGRNQFATISDTEANGGSDGDREQSTIRWEVDTVVERLRIASEKWRVIYDMCPTDEFLGKLDRESYDAQRERGLFPTVAECKPKSYTKFQINGGRIWHRLSDESFQEKLLADGYLDGTRDNWSWERIIWAKWASKYEAEANQEIGTVDNNTTNTTSNSGSSRSGRQRTSGGRQRTSGGRKRGSRRSGSRSTTPCQGCSPPSPEPAR